MLLVVVASHREWLCCARALGIPIHLAGRSGPVEARPGLALLRTGVGAETAQDAADRVRTLQPELLLHVGYAGALRAGLNPGDLVVVTGVSGAVQSLHDKASSSPPPAIDLDPKLTDLLRAELALLPDRLAQGRLLTVSQFVDRSQDKLRLGADRTYLACDMEASVLLAATRDTGAKYVGLRAISDSSHHQMPPGLRDRGIGPVLAWAGTPGQAALDTWHMLHGWRRASAALQRAVPAALAALQDR